MKSSAEIALLYRVSELARRFGLRPIEAEAHLSWLANEHGDGVYELYFPSGPDVPGTDKGDRFQKMMNALGCEGPRLRTDIFETMEDAVERAISLAPRARARALG